MNRRPPRGVAGLLAGLGALVGVAAAVELADRRATAADPTGHLLDPLEPTDRLTLRSADGTAIAVEVHGRAGAPAVVLAHAWACSSRLWVRQVRELSRRYRVVVYDQRGHGASRARRVACSPEALAADLDAVLDGTLAAGERAVLAGHSMGAMTIVAWAGAHPDAVRRRVAAAALVDTAVHDLVGAGLVAPGGVAMKALTGWALLASPWGSPRTSPLSRRLVRRVALSPRASAAAVALSEQLVLDCPVAVRTGWGNVLTGLDLRHEVAALDVPTAVLVGLDDLLTPPVQSRRLAALLPRLDELVELEGVGHMAPVEAADEVTDLLDRLVREHLMPPEAPDAAAGPTAGARLTERTAR